MIHVAKTSAVDVELHGAPTVGSRWGGDRIKIAGIAGLLGGALLTLMSFDPDTMLGAEGSIGFLVYQLAQVVVFLLPAIAILGAHALYGHRYGIVGRIVVYAWAAAFVGMSISTISYAFAPDTHPLMPLANVSFLGSFLLATVVGVLYLWKTPVSRIAAGLLAITIPSAVVGFQLLMAGLLPFAPLFALFELPMFVGIAALGAHLIAHADEADAMFHEDAAAVEAADD